MGLIREAPGDGPRPLRRSRSAGVDARGNGEWGIALRCAEVDSPRRGVRWRRHRQRLGPCWPSWPRHRPSSAPCSSRSRPDADAGLSSWPGRGGSAGRRAAGGAAPSPPPGWSAPPPSGCPLSGAPCPPPAALGQARRPPASRHGGMPGGGRGAAERPAAAGCRTTRSRVRGTRPAPAARRSRPVVVDPRPRARSGRGSSGRLNRPGRSCRNASPRAARRRARPRPRWWASAAPHAEETRPSMPLAPRLASTVTPARGAICWSRSRDGEAEAAQQQRPVRAAAAARSRASRGSLRASSASRMAGRGGARRRVRGPPRRQPPGARCTAPRQPDRRGARRWRCGPGSAQRPGPARPRHAAGARRTVRAVFR